MMSEEALREALTPRPDVFPMGSRIVVVDPPAAGERSGLVLPQNADVDQLSRGIILRLPEVAETEGLNGMTFAFQDMQLAVLRVGDVVYYRGYYRVNDVKVVEAGDIIAYEQTAARETDPE